MCKYVGDQKRTPWLLEESLQVGRDTVTTIDPSQREACMFHRALVICLDLRTCLCGLDHVHDHPSAPVLDCQIRVLEGVKKRSVQADWAASLKSMVMGSEVWLSRPCVVRAIMMFCPLTRLDD